MSWFALGAGMYGLVTAADRSGPAPQNGLVQVSELWLVLRNRWPWIIWSVAAFTLIACLYSLVTPPLYSSTAQILVDSRARQVVKDSNPESVASDGGIVQAESQARVIESSGVLLRAIAATDLLNDPEFNGSSFLRRILAPFLTKWSGSSTVTAEARTLSALRRVLAVKRADKVLVVEVVVTTKSAEKSAKIANAIADAYMLDQSDAKAEASKKASADLTARLDGQRQRVQDAEIAVEKYKSQNQIVTTSGQLLVEQKLGDATAQFVAAKSKSVRLKSQIDQLDRLRRVHGGTDATAEAIQSNVIGALREQESALVQTQSDLRSQYGPLHPKMAAVQSQMSNLQRLIAMELGRIEQASRAQYERALAEERQIEDYVDRLKSETLATGQASIRLRDLERDVEASRSIYSAFLARAQEMREQANIDTTNSRIISHALPAPERSWPLMGLILFGAFCAGLGLGVALAFVVEYLSPTPLTANYAKVRVRPRS
jgi:succinoglycan biosynthesis transport protein ExoP